MTKTSWPARHTHCNTKRPVKYVTKTSRPMRGRGTAVHVSTILLRGLYLEGTGKKKATRAQGQVPQASQRHHTAMSTLSGRHAPAQACRTSQLDKRASFDLTHNSSGSPRRPPPHRNQHRRFRCTR